MPQFDISIFIVQLISLYFSLLCFYFLFSWKYLPSWAFLLKTRKRLQKSESTQNLYFDNYDLKNINFNSKFQNSTKKKVLY